MAVVIPDDMFIVFYFHICVFFVIVHRSVDYFCSADQVTYDFISIILSYQPIQPESYEA